MRWPIRKQIIYGCDLRGDGESPYMTRWMLLSRVYLHLFHRSDADDRHDHPFGFWVFVLWRGYIEDTPNGRRRIWPCSLRYCPPEWVHRVELIGGKPAVTLVVRGPKVREWGFFTPAGWIQWQDYFARLGCK